jgi:hypothetical protein
MPNTFPTPSFHLEHPERGILTFYKHVSRLFPEHVPRDEHEARARAAWRLDHAWTAIGVMTRARLLAECTECDVLYVGPVGYQPPWGYRAAATRFERREDEKHLYVRYQEPLWVIPDTPSRIPFLVAGWSEADRFDFDGMGDDRDSAPLALVPRGWMPEPFPGDPIVPMRGPLNEPAAACITDDELRSRIRTAEIQPVDLMSESAYDRRVELLLILYREAWSRGITRNTWQ